MILFPTVGIYLCVGALVWDIINQPTVPLITRIILFTLCGVILSTMTVILKWSVKYNYWKCLCKRIDANKEKK